LQHDLSIAAVADLFKVYGGSVPKSFANKIKHISAIQKLTMIMALNKLTNSGCTNSKGGCTMSKGGDYSTTKGGYHI
jgi:hypothetical protein